MRNRHSRSGEYDVEFLRRCKRIEIGKHPLRQDLPFFQPLLLLKPALGQLIQLIHTFLSLLILFCQELVHILIS